MNNDQKTKNMECVTKTIIENSIVVVKDSIQHKQQECDFLFNYLVKQFDLIEYEYVYDMLFDYVYNFPDDQNLNNVVDIIYNEQLSANKSK